VSEVEDADRIEHFRDVRLLDVGERRPGTTENRPQRGKDAGQNVRSIDS
jgi:hypothetical protein